MEKPSSRRVVIYRRNILPWSETFIREQALALQSWHAILIGERRVDNGLQLDQLNLHLLPDTQKSLLSRIVRHLYHRLRLPYPPHLRIFHQLNANLIHAHFGFDGTLVWPIARALNLPLLVTLHGYDINIHRGWWENGQGGRLLVNYPGQLLQMAQDPRVHWIAVSEAIRRQAISFGIPEGKITTCYIGVDTDRFQPSGKPLSERRKRILFVGRMVEKKGPLLMISAFAQVRERIPNAELVMVGDGPLRIDAEALANRLQLPVVFTGALTSNQIISQLQEARVFCLPSITAPNGDAEGFGLVLLEAQACGVPVVSSARGGALEGIIDGISGFSCTENEIDCFGKRLTLCLSDNFLIDGMSNAATTFVCNNFDLKDKTKILEKIYYKLSTEYQ